MITDLCRVVENDIEFNKDSIWVLLNSKNIEYSDGSEQYLEQILPQVNDLSSTSHELEKWIKDWGSEYHLSRKRTQLLSGFDFNRSISVLEVGCGCGAITRFLGETFDSVVSIEGSLNRAKVARMRTNGMKNVSILCAPFQEIIFKEQFDMVFSIGVFEYSGMYVNANNPYESILQYFDNLLKPDGKLILAIENQFGLKYFSSSKEDHTNIMFDGIEGYRHYGDKVRTFGYDELNVYLKKHFCAVDFYFPYPDYKMPSCVLSEQFFNRVKGGELVGRYQSKDYLSGTKPLFDQNIVCIELDRNNKLPFFSNSFLVVAGKKKVNDLKLKGLGILYNSDRAPEFQTITRFLEHDDGDIWVHKEHVSKEKNMSDTLLWNPLICKWESGISLQGLITQRVKEKKTQFKELFAPCNYWIKNLKSLSINQNEMEVISGEYVDCLWSNSFIKNNECIFIDQEWNWQKKLNLNIIVIRAIFYFLNDISHMIDLHPTLKKSSMKSLIRLIAKSINVELSDKDFIEFIEFESKFQSIVYNTRLERKRVSIKLCLWNRTFIKYVLCIKNGLNKIKVLLLRRWDRFRGF